MKTKHMMMVAGLLGLAALCVVPGCEGNSSPDTGGVDSYFANNPFVSDPRLPNAPQDVVISPVNAAVSFVGQLVTFKVTGGSPAYHWGVANGNGTIISRSEDTSQGIYTATTLAGNSVIVYDAYGHSAIATVGVGTGSALAIAPSTATLTNNTQVLAFTVSGGTPPYTWTVLNGHGSLNTSAGASVLYTRISAGDNGLTANDSAGASISIVIQQP